MSAKWCQKQSTVVQQRDVMSILTGSGCNVSLKGLGVKKKQENAGNLSEKC